MIKAMVERPHEINTLLGNAGAIAHTLAPEAAFRVLNMAYHVFPDSAAAKGDGGTRESEQIMLASSSGRPLVARTDLAVTRRRDRRLTPTGRASRSA